MLVCKRWMLALLRARQKRTVLLLTVCAIAWALLRRARARAHARLAGGKGSLTKRVGSWAATDVAANAVVRMPPQLMVRKESSDHEDLGLAAYIDLALNFLNMSLSCPILSSSDNGCEMVIREVLLPIKGDIKETHMPNRAWRRRILDALMVCFVLVSGMLVLQHLAAIGLSLTLWAILRCTHGQPLTAQESNADYAVGLATAEVPSSEAYLVWETARSWARLGAPRGCRRSFERRGSLGVAVEASPATTVSVPFEAVVLQPHNAGQTGRSMRVHAYRVSRPHSKRTGAGAQAASTLGRLLTDAGCATVRIRQDVPDAAVHAREALDLAMRRIDGVAAWTHEGECGGVLFSSLDVPGTSLPIFCGTAEFTGETISDMGFCGSQPLTARAVFAYACSFQGASLLDPTLERVTVLHDFRPDIILSNHLSRPMQRVDLLKDGSRLTVYRHTPCSDSSTRSRHTMVTTTAPDELLQPHQGRLKALHAGRSFAVSPLLMSALDVQQKIDGGIRICCLLHLDPHLLSSAASRAQIFAELRIAAGRISTIVEAAHSWFSNVLTLPSDAHPSDAHRLALEGPDPEPVHELQDVLLQGHTFRSHLAVAVALGTVKLAEG